MSDKKTIDENKLTPKTINQFRKSIYLQKLLELSDAQIQSEFQKVSKIFQEQSEASSQEEHSVLSDPTSGN